MQKIIFDVKGRPELGAAIIARLVQLGYKEPTVSSPPGTYVNVSIGYSHYVGTVHCGQCPTDSGMWEEFDLLTLTDLYDNKRWLPKAKNYKVTLGTQEVSIPKELYKKIKALAEEQESE